MRPSIDSNHSPWMSWAAARAGGSGGRAGERGERDSPAGVGEAVTCFSWRKVRLMKAVGVWTCL